MVFRPSAIRGHLFLYSIKRAFYGTVCYLISSKYPNALICFMDTIPFDLPDAAYAWADLSEAILEAGFDESTATGRNLIDQWDEPDEPIWSILSANWLCENAASVREQIDGVTRNRSRLEQFLTCLVRNFRQAIAVKKTYSDLEQLQRLVLVQHVAELYNAVHGWGLQRCEGSLLQVLFASGHSTAIHLGVDLLLTKPPVDWADVFSVLGTADAVQNMAGWGRFSKIASKHISGGTVSGLGCCKLRCAKPVPGGTPSQRGFVNFAPNDGRPGKPAWDARGEPCPVR